MKASIVIPAYNAEEYITESVLSALSQEGNPEVIVVDDGSKDLTAKTAAYLGARVISLGNNQGAATALNVGLFFACSEYVCWLSADDFYLESDKTQRQIEAMDKSGSDFSFCRESFSGHDLKSMKPRHKTLFWLVPSHPFAAVWLDNPIDGSSVMLRKSSIDKYGNFDARMRNQDADGELWLRWLKQGAKLEIVPGRGTFYRLHDGQSSANRLQWYKAIIKNRLRYMI